MLLRVLKKTDALFEKLLPLLILMLKQTKHGSYIETHNRDRHITCKENRQQRERTLYNTEREDTQERGGERERERER